MKRLHALILISLTGAVFGSGFGQTTEEPFSITISTDKPTITVQAAPHVRIMIKLSNTSDHAVNCSAMVTNGLNRSYLYDVRDQNGKSIEIPGEHHELRGGSWEGPCELAQGESMNASSRIGVLYDFTKPGRYTVQLSKYIGNNEKEGAVKSNTITITVTE
jgi:hypothetical protein